VKEKVADFWAEDFAAYIIQHVTHQEMEDNTPSGENEPKFSHSAWESCPI
jgi:hypothetical protein